MDKTQVQNVITTKTTDDKLSVAVKKTNSIEDQDLSQFITVQSPISPKEEAQEEDESTEEETTEEEEEQSPSKGGFLKFGIKKGTKPVYYK